MYRVKPYESAHWPLAKRAIYKLYNQLWRDTKRKLILNSVAKLSPCPPFTRKYPTYSLHTLLDYKNFQMGVVSYKSLVLAAQQPINFVFHDDGSLTTLQINYLHAHFPGCRVISQAEARQYMNDYLTPFPNCLHVRQNHVLFPKVTDVKAYATAERIGFMDSDVLFFRKPTHFLDALENGCHTNYFNKDIKTSYFLPASVLSEIFSIQVKEQLNSGLWVVNRADIDIPRLERFIQDNRLPDLVQQYLLDQTLLAVLASSSVHSVDYLPPTYDVSFEKDVTTTVCKHYVGRIRHGFELEGLTYLLKEMDFINRWELFVKTYN
jgi:hypothetical protein